MAVRPKDEAIMGLFTWIPTGESASSCGAELNEAIDIIAVQGLGASPYYTWIKKVGVEEVMWLRDLLPQFVPRARIATFSYRSDWYTWKKGAKTSIRELGEQLLTALHGDRQSINASRRPIVFVGHSMGGLVIQQALVLANNRPDYEDIKISTAGVVFLGTPHAGIDIAGYAKFLAVVKGNDPTLLKQLEPNKQELYNLSHDFAAGYKHLSITCFYEKLNQAYVGGHLQVPVVDQRSAVQVGREMIYLLADHSGLNKFSGVDDPNFKLVREVIAGMVDKASKREAPRLHDRQFMVSRQPNPLFTGRKFELEKLQKALCPLAVKDKQNSGAIIYVLYGMGGAGKSEVALKFIYDHRLEFWGIFWINARSEASIKTSFADISRRCGLDGSSNSAVSWLQDTSQPWLLILDNADDPNINLSPYLPAGIQGCILITSRLPGCAQKYSNAGNDHYEQLSEETAVELLLRSCGINSIGWSESKDDAHLIVDLLGCHALAVVQAGAAVSQGICSLGEYKSMFLNQRRALLNSSPDLTNSEYGNVYATFEVSARYLEGCSDQAAKDALHLLDFHAFMHFSDFPEEAFQEAWKNSKNKDLVMSHLQPSDEKMIYWLDKWHRSNLPTFMRQNLYDDELDMISLRTARAKLASLSLINIDMSNGITRVHPVTHAWSRDRLKDSESARAWLSALAMLSLTIPRPDHYRPLIYQLQPHLESMVKCPSYYDVYKDAFGIQQSFYRLATVLFYSHSYSAAREMLQLIPGNIDSTWIKTRNGQAIQLLQAEISMQRGDLEEAGALLDQIAIPNVEKLEHKNYIQMDILQVVARFYIRNGHEIARVIPILERLVGLRGRKIGDADNDYILLGLQYDLAVAHQMTGDLRKAKVILEQVVQTGTKTRKAEDISQLASEHDLALVCLELGDTIEATRILEQVTQKKSILLQPNNPHRLHSEHILAKCYYKSGRYEESLRLARSIERPAQNHPDYPLADRVTRLIRKCLKANELKQSFKGYKSPQEGEEETEDEDESPGSRRGKRRRLRE